MVISTTFKNISVLLMEEPEYPEKTTDLLQVTVWETFFPFISPFWQVASKLYSPNLASG
jgi:hypothetical protein